MQAWRERRISDGPRVPLEDVLVRVAPRDVDGDFEADAVDVGLGGIAMTAPLLPHVGSEMFCTFTAPDDGSLISAACEVVWAHDSGPHIGKFGLRFRNLETRSERALRKIVDRWQEGLNDADRDRRLPAHERGDDLPSARVKLEGLSTPIEGEAVLRTARELVVEQSLPFLSLGKNAAEGEREGRLADVQLRVEDGVPRLLLTLSFETTSEQLDGKLESELKAEATLVDGDPPPITFGDEFDDGEAELQGDLDEEQALCGADTTLDDDFVPEPALEELRGVSRERGRAFKRSSFDRADEAIESETLEEERFEEENLDEESRAEHRGRLQGSSVTRSASLATLLARWGLRPESVVSALARMRTTLAALACAGMLTLRKAWAVAAPSMGGLLRRAARTLSAFGAALRGRRKTSAPKRRRTTRPKEIPLRTQGRTTGRRQAVDAATTPMRKTLIRSAFAFAIVGVTVVLLLPRTPASEASGQAGARVQNASASAQESVSPAIEAPRQVAAPAPATVVSPYAPAPIAAASPATSTAAVAGSAEPSTMAAQLALPAQPSSLSVGHTAPSMPRALPEPSYDSGRIAAPTFPSVGRAEAAAPGGAGAGASEQGARVAATQPQAAPRAAPTSTGATDRGRASGRQFGADRVREGRTFTLRMSQPVREVRGEALPNGFRVIVPGSLSLDPARIIANNHVKVERAMILNRGDHAELVVRFVEGKSPDYQVRGEGAALQVTIGR